MNKLEKMAIKKIKHELYESLKEFNEVNYKREFSYASMPIKRCIDEALSILDAIEENQEK